ncbi:MAG: hypothetical protein JWN40_1209 [Phycisphaerales bacterium]|nr:hypothetical protein [Phycisphaerales bacterium]
MKQKDRSKLAAGDCPTPEHTLHRRMFLKGLASGAGAISLGSFAGLFSMPAFAEQAKKEQKHCILLWLCGAPSQFETWDPKPGTLGGGPFRAIPTKVPGIQVSSLMPRCASIMDKLAVVRSMSTKPSEHFQGINLLNRGAEPRQPFVRPVLGSVLAQQLGHLDSAIPNFILLDPCPEGNEFREFKAGNMAGWLGAQYGPVRAGGSYGIPDIQRLADMTVTDQADREALRQFLVKKYENDHKSAAAGSQNAAFERVKGLMSCASLFDINRLPEADRNKYGPGTFGTHALLARNLVENGAPFVMVANGMPWDCHILNHETHQMLVPELDRVIYHLVTDLEERGLLDKTLVIAMGEFGRSPWMNASHGREHYPTAWSLAMAGCGLKRGVVVGATDPQGYEPIEKPFNEKNLFATIFKALGIDPYAEYDLPHLPTFHRVEDNAPVINEILA